MKFRVSFTAALLAAGLPLMSLQAAPLQAVPAVQAGNATQATMLAAGWAGERVVAVGDHGVVLLSDDQGRQWRQARSVPLSTPLTGVSFVDARHGWAVGHWGAICPPPTAGILAGPAPVERRRPAAVRRALFDARQGVAVGLWSLVLTTEDGGKTWTEQPLQAPSGAKRADLNLMGLFADNHSSLYATAEHGQVLRSDDQGRTGVTWIPAMKAPCGLARCWPMGVCCWVVSVAPCCRLCRWQGFSQSANARQGLCHIHSSGWRAGIGGRA